ncbi:hypothetical protein [Chitinophaga rhizosphaerae]|uniref:hypothetical protein n=1 Tax=Chitinophaga rhizosphaerae TaxID=1864947 RepID=UPI000F81164E|nr:hypothetical protein [Chitinophaga rhizosphaerae]
MDFKEFGLYYNAEADRQEYQERVQRLINTLDFDKLAVIRNKSLSELTEDDLATIGFLPHPSQDFAKLYYFSDLDNIKIYLTIEDGAYSIRRYRLQLDKTLSTTAELIDVALIGWKLKMK